MKHVATLFVATMLASTSQAAIVSVNVTGVLGDWYTKIFSQPVIYQTFLVGNPDIVVQGSLSYDDSTDLITALSLSQQGSLVAAVNNNAVDVTYMTISGLSWGLTGSSIDQLTGSASCVNTGTTSGACAAVSAAINTSAYTSPFEFDGVAQGFRVGGVRQIPRDGYVETIDAGTDIYIDVFSDEAFAPNPSFNAIHNSLFQLTVTTVPVPAAAWLFGSALLGLVGVKRRRD